MNHSFSSRGRSITTVLLALLIAVAGNSLLIGQDDDPFGDPFGSKPAMTDVDTDPFGTSPDPSGSTSGGSLSPRGSGKITKVEDNPIVLTIQESNPATASELVYAISLLVDIDKLDLAKGYLDKLMALDIDDKTMFELNMKFKSATFVRMRRFEELLPDAAIFARRLFAASDRYARDPDRVASFVANLNDPNVDARVAAATGLLIAREDAVQPLMTALMDDSQKANHADYLIALSRLDTIASEPLKVIAHSSDRDSFIKASQALVVAEDRSVLPALVGRRLLAEEGSAMETFSLNMIEKLTDSRPSKSVARQYLENRFDEILQRADTVAENDLVDQWEWAAESRTLSKTETSAKQLLLDRAAEISRTLHQYDQEDSSAKMRYWISLLESQKFGLEPDQSLDAANFPEASPEYLEAVLVQSMKDDRIEAAIGAVELLKVRGNADLLRSVGGQPSPVVKAVMNPNRRLQFAAIDAILKWDPKKSFAGSSHFIKVAGLFAGINGEDKMLLVEPNSVYADTLAGVMNTIGFEADKANTGREFISKAVDSADYEFALISSNVSNPQILELMQRLRRDPRSAGLPIGLVTRKESDLRRLEQYAETDQNAIALRWPISQDSAEALEERMKKLWGRDHATNETRIRQASVALDGLLNIARNRQDYSFYRLLPLEPLIGRAIHHTELGEKGIELLGWLATPDSQKELVMIAAQESMPVEHRQAAVNAFANAVNRRGILLTKREILRQYERYNASEFMDKESQQVLASILDAMERRTSTSSDSSR